MTQQSDSIKESAEQRAARSEAESAAAFDKFLTRSEVKLLVSMVPATEPPELLRTLLRNAFDAGAQHGTGSVVMELTGALLKSMDNDPLRATDEESVENLDKVRAVILDDAKRLEMSHWHGSADWLDRTCAEEAVCGTTHCLAGWLQVCATKPELREMPSELAGALSAPVATKMFFRKAPEVLSWLEERRYVVELEEAIANRELAKEVNGGAA